MEEKTPFLQNQSVRYGLFIGLANIIFALVMYVIDPKLLIESWYSWIIGIVNILLLIFGMIARKKQMGGFMTYGQAFKSGFTIALIAVIIGTVYNVLFYNIIAPEMKDLIIEQKETEMIESGEMDDDQIEQAITFSKKFFNLFLVLGGLIGGMIVNLVLVLIISIFVRKDPDPFAMQAEMDEEDME